MEFFSDVVKCYFSGEVGMFERLILVVLREKGGLESNINGYNGEG